MVALKTSHLPTDLQWWEINPDWLACLTVIKVDEAEASFRPAGWDSHYFPRYVILLSSLTSIYNTPLSLRLFSHFPKPSAHQIPLLDFLHSLFFISMFSLCFSVSLSLSPLSPGYLVWFIASCWKGWRFNNSAPPHPNEERENVREEEL